jgi:hypothetical protein
MTATPSSRRRFLRTLLAVPAGVSGIVAAARAGQAAPADGVEQSAEAIWRLYREAWQSKSATGRRALGADTAKEYAGLAAEQCRRALAFERAKRFLSEAVA